MPSERSNLRCRVLAVALLAALGCTEPPPPPYTRLHDAAPTIEGLPAGAALVVFWATWCPPCREELPALRALASKPPHRITVVTFGEDEEEAAVREYFRGAPPPEIGYRRDVDRRAATAFGVDVLPAAFLVVEGRLVARLDSFRAWDTRGMRRLLAKLASEAQPPSAVLESPKR